MIYMTVKYVFSNNHRFIITRFPGKGEVFNVDQQVPQQQVDYPSNDHSECPEFSSGKIAGGLRGSSQKSRSGI